MVKGTNQPSIPADSWRALAFDDSTWRIMPAPFHYGENLPGGTLLSDMRGNYSSIFLRRSFEVSNPTQLRALELRAICDDGFIAWLNGVEVVRYNVAPGEPPFNQLAATAVAEPVAYAVYSLPASLLLAGRNVLAVQVFNSSLTSSDLQWDASLTGFEADFEPPRVLSVEPPPGVIEQSAAITITFSEPVTGVRAGDLFLGAAPAQSVTGSAHRYTFFFELPRPGSAELRWDADTVITDFGLPANLFDPLGAGTWAYEIRDLTPPRVADISPPPGSTVKTLTEIEVRFSEAVEGVDATDLLVNGEAAREVVGTGAGPYWFGFEPLPKGMARFSWATGHGIHDLGLPPNPFSAQSWVAAADPDYEVPPVRINEFLAANVAAGGLKDEDGELQDWIELYNEGSLPVNLEGWSLTDDRDDPGRWIFPPVSVGPGEFLLLFASGKDRKETNGSARLHTNFKLNPAGEYLALLNHEQPRVVVSEFAPRYPEQRNDYSYGFAGPGESGYFRTPTPGSRNTGNPVSGAAPLPHVNVERGWFDHPFTLIVTPDLPGITYRYTLDGSEPTESNGATLAGPMRITHTTILRLAGFKEGLLPSAIATHTYLFPSDILRQSNSPPGFPVGPTVMTGFPSDYEMDPEIVTNALYAPILKDALLALPAISLVCRTDDMFGRVNGIYTHPLSRGPNWEKPCSVEFLPHTSSGFQTAAGVQIQGNAAREPHKQPKHPLRLVFKGDYGPTRLEFPLFPDAPAEDFDTLILRADFNFSWLHWLPGQRVRAQRTRDAWSKDSMRAMGGVATHNRYVHLFINGLYWGIYDPSERPDAAFAATYFGGEKEDYDVMNEGEVVDGDRRAYDAMLAVTDLAAPAGFERIQPYLNLTQFIDYMLLHFYGGHQDWGRDKNWYAVRPRDGRTGFFYLPWDSEMILDDPNYNRVTSPDTPSDLHRKLVANPEYRLAFADRVQKHLFHDGALTPGPVQERWLARARQIELAIVAESARWGDYRRDIHQFETGPYQLYTRDEQWRAEQKRLLTQYFPRRTSILLGQLRAAGLYPSVAAPEFNQFGGQVKSGFTLELTAADGVIYFTLDGTDPRAPIAGSISSRARIYTGPLPLTRSTRVQARALRTGVWSALATADFRVNEAGLPLRITEVMYHPRGGDAYEYLELQNAGLLPIDAGGFSFKGIEYLFPPGTVLQPGEIALLASAVSPSLFSTRYPRVRVAGYFKGALANNGERVELRDREGRLVAAVAYSDQGAWPARADGTGASLEIIDPAGDPGDPANWQASRAPIGSPGEVPPAAGPGAVRLNEVFAAGVTGTASNETNDTADWIELANRSDGPVSLAGWLLTDHRGGWFAFPPGFVLPAKELLIVKCDGLTNQAGFHAPFKLDKDGETVGLYNSAFERVDAVSFGSQAAGFSTGRANRDEWELCLPTPGGNNVPAELASVANLRINEWLANPRPGEDDWLELYNPDTSGPVAIKGLAVTTPEGAFQIQARSSIAPGGYARLFADERWGARHIGLTLSALGGFIALVDSDGVEIDRVVYPSQNEGVSTGRWPDGQSNIVAFTGRPTPGESNAHALGNGLLLSELMVGSGETPGWVELWNQSDGLIDASGYEIRFGPAPGKKAMLPAGSLLSSFDFLVVREDLTGIVTNPESVLPGDNRWLTRAGGTVELRDRSGRIVAALDYGAQIPGLSIGLIGSAWGLLSSPTPGTTNAPGALLGDTGNLRINEWFASSTPGATDGLELFNSDSRPVSLGGLFLSDRGSIDGWQEFQIPPLSFMGGRGWLAWVADNHPSMGPGHLNFALDRLGESLRLSAADGRLIDAVDFGAQLEERSEGRLVDGGPDIGVLLAGPSLGISNESRTGPPDRDGDGLPDEWEIAQGTNPDQADGDEDPDADRLSNVGEFRAGTNPHDADSSLNFRAVQIRPDSVALQFMAVANRAYRLLSKDALMEAAWIEVTRIPAEPFSRLETVLDRRLTTSNRFYRLVTP